MSGSSLLTVVDEGPVRWLTLNRPMQRNALNPSLADALQTAVHDALAAVGVEVLVVAGSGRSFCAGADLRHLHSSRDKEGPMPLLEAVSTCCSMLEQGPKPVVAALHGHVVAGGLELALACDILVAEEGTLVGDGHAAMGLLPGAGSSVRLVRRAPEPLARWLLLSGELVPAESLHSVGLIHTIAPRGSLKSAVRHVCERLLRPNLTTQRAIKGLLGAQRDMVSADALAAELVAFDGHWQAECSPELDAFVAKSRPAMITELAAGGAG